MSPSNFLSSGQASEAFRKWTSQLASGFESVTMARSWNLVKLYPVA